MASRRRQLSVEIAASCHEVFTIVHDYDRRLLWDPMLTAARILGEATRAGVGVRTSCTGTWRNGHLALETEYVSFDPGQVAAVKMIRPTGPFARFAATIRHEPCAPGRSRVVYIYSFEARPRLLARALAPLLDQLLARETRRRLEALRRYCERPA